MHNVFNMTTKDGENGEVSQTLHCQLQTEAEDKNEAANKIAAEINLAFENDDSVKVSATGWGDANKVRLDVTASGNPEEVKQIMILCMSMFG